MTEYSDFVFAPISTTPSKSSTTTINTTAVTAVTVVAPVAIQSSSVALANEEFEFIDLSSTIPIEHFDLIDDILESSTIAGGVAVAQDDSELNWWDLNEAFTQSLTTTNVRSTSTNNVIDSDQNP